MMVRYFGQIFLLIVVLIMCTIWGMKITEDNMNIVHGLAGAPGFLALPMQKLLELKQIINDFPIMILVDDANSWLIGMSNLLGVFMQEITRIILQFLFSFQKN